MDAQSLNTLNTVLARQVEAAQALEQLIARERSLLTGEDAAAVEAVASEKAALLNRIEALETDRRQVLAMAGLGLNGPAMERLIRGQSPLPAPARAETGRLWSALVAAMERCRDGNDVNGAIVGLRQRQVRQLLNILRTGREDELTYGPSGRAGSGSARGLARA